MRKLIATSLGAILTANLAAAQQPLVPIPNPYPQQLPTRPLTPSPFPQSQPASNPPVVPNPYPPQGFPLQPGAQPQPGSLQPAQPTAPPMPGRLPSLTGAPPNVTQGQANPPAAKPAPAFGSQMPLPYAEQKFALRATDVAVRRTISGWEVWTGQKVLRNTGESEASAQDLARVLRELRPTEWVAIGGAKPVVEYGLTNGRPAVTGGAVPEAKEGGTGEVLQSGGASTPRAGAGGAKFVLPIDLRSTRVEPVRGVWVVRDDSNILLNFGTDKGGAEQAGAAIQHYGFNRLGIVGPPTQPIMSYLFASADPVKAISGGAMVVQSQIEGLTRTGIPVPGVGFTGEMIKIDPRGVEARKDGLEWVVAFGPEVLGRFGPTEWAAREAARTIRDGRFTEFCKLGGVSGMTFFLVDGKPPTRVALASQGRNFDPAALKTQQVNGRWAVTESGRQLFEVGSAQEGETVIRVLKAFGFDQSAHLSAGGAKGGISFLVKNRR
ncbi:hypothetical protein R5W23_005195 [Gemmata sp. JC673]|uniref:Phosphodiester glycosidase domain-containing protein n=1 Tax=Gemmata algarum TaxID=2975278 RepID=A0ABU5F8B6_9BACT|nr:hypothetical protein [Gemmata algarum]MDY3563581.1 hypothetical protein [Gemmata algarum]